MSSSCSVWLSVHGQNCIRDSGSGSWSLSLSLSLSWGVIVIQLDWWCWCPLSRGGDGGGLGFEKLQRRKREIHFTNDKGKKGNRIALLFTGIITWVPFSLCLIKKRNSYIMSWILILLWDFFLFIYFFCLSKKRIVFTTMYKQIHLGALWPVWQLTIKVKRM